MDVRDFSDDDDEGEPLTVRLVTRWRLAVFWPTRAKRRSPRTTSTAGASRFDGAASA